MMNSAVKAPGHSVYRKGVKRQDPNRMGQLLETLLRVSGTPEEEFLRAVIKMQAMFRGAIRRKRMEEQKKVRHSDSLTSHVSVMSAAEKKAKLEATLEQRHHGGADAAQRQMDLAGGMQGHHALQKVLAQDGNYEFESNNTNPFLPWSIKRKVYQPAQNNENNTVGYWDSSAQEAISNEKRALENQIGKLKVSLEKRTGVFGHRERAAAASLMAPSEREKVSPRKGFDHTPRPRKGWKSEKVSQEVAALEQSEDLLTRGVFNDELPEAVLSTGTDVASRSLGDRHRVPWAQHKGEIPWATMRRPNKVDEDSEQMKKIKEVIGIISQKAHLKFKNVRDAFRLVDVDKSGLVNRQEMSVFVRQFNLPLQYGDLLFDAMDADNSGYIDYVEFMEHFGPVIQPGCQPFHTYRSPLSRAGQRMFEPNAVGWSLRKLG